MADASYLTHSRTRVQRQEGVEIVVSVKNERNLASLTMYGDIEGQDPFSTNISSNEIYITAGVVSTCTDRFNAHVFDPLRYTSRGRTKVRRKCNFALIIVEWCARRPPNIEQSTWTLSL